MLTPADVEQKTFSTALRGYDLDEVDDFLDEVVATIRELSEQLEEAQAAARAATSVAAAPEPEPTDDTHAAAEPPAPAPSTDIDESAIGRALVAAQTAADRLLEEAESEASRIVEEAKGEADSWSAEREAKRREAEVEISTLAAMVASVRSELAVLAGEVSEKLDDMEAVIEGSGPVDGDRLDEDDDPDLSRDGADDLPADEPEPDAAGDDAGEAQRDEGADHLDEMLTGVVTDLQLRSDDEDLEDPGEDE